MDHDRDKGEGVGPQEYTALKIRVLEPVRDLPELPTTRAAQLARAPPSSPVCRLARWALAHQPHVAESCGACTCAVCCR